MRTALLIATMAALVGCSGMFKIPRAGSLEPEERGATEEMDLEVTTTPPIVYAQSAGASQATATEAPQPARIRVFLTSDDTPGMCTVESIDTDGAHITYKCGDTPPPWAGGEEVAAE